MHEPEIVPPENGDPTPAVAPEVPLAPAAPLALTQPVAPWWHTALLVAFLLSMSIMGGLVTKKQQLVGHQMQSYLFAIISEWLMLGFVWWGLWMRRVPLKALLGERFKGWRGFGRDLAYAAVFWILAVLVLDAASLLLKLMHVGKGTPPGKVLALAPATPLEFLLWFFVCASAGICEEMIFRGYLLRQFSSLGGKVWLGVVLSSLIFGASHGYEGISIMIVIFLYGVLFCLLLLKSKSLRPGMMAHGWHDFITGVLLALAHHLHRI